MSNRCWRDRHELALLGRNHAKTICLNREAVWRAQLGTSPTQQVVALAGNFDGTVSLVESELVLGNASLQRNRAEQHCEHQNAAERHDAGGATAAWNHQKFWARRTQGNRRCAACGLARQWHGEQWIEQWIE